MTLRFYKRGPVAIQNNPETHGLWPFWRTGYYVGCDLAMENLSYADYLQIFDSICESKGELTALLPLES